MFWHGRFLEHHAEAACSTMGCVMMTQRGLQVDAILSACMLGWVAPCIDRQGMTLLGVIQSNIVNTTNWALTDEEYAAITGIKHQLRLLDGCPWLHEVGPYRYCHLLSLRRVPPASKHCFLCLQSIFRRGNYAYAYENSQIQYLCVEGLLYQSLGIAGPLTLADRTDSNCSSTHSPIRCNVLCMVWP